MDRYSRLARHRQENITNSKQYLIHIRNNHEDFSPFGKRSVFGCRFIATTMNFKFKEKLERENLPKLQLLMSKRNSEDGKKKRSLLVSQTCPSRPISKDVMQKPKNYKDYVDTHRKRPTKATTDTYYRQISCRSKGSSPPILCRTMQVNQDQSAAIILPLRRTFRQPLVTETSYSPPKNKDFKGMLSGIKKQLQCKFNMLAAYEAVALQATKPTAKFFSSAQEESRLFKSPQKPVRESYTPWKAEEDDSMEFGKQ